MITITKLLHGVEVVDQTSIQVLSIWDDPSPK